jgi:hypothetical protein
MVESKLEWRRIKNMEGNGMEGAQKNVYSNVSRMAKKGTTRRAKERMKMRV